MAKTVSALVAVAGLAASVPAMAAEMRADEARRFVIESLFSFTCFEGTSGEGRIRADGSVEGAIRIGGSGPTRYASLPPGTLRVRGESICAMLRPRPHRREELSRFTGRNELRVLPIHEAAQSAWDG